MTNTKTFKGQISSGKQKIQFAAVVTPGIFGIDRGGGECITCGGRVVRSHKTGILWRRCSICRRLVMIYGPSIHVTRTK